MKSKTSAERKRARDRFKETQTGKKKRLLDHIDVYKRTLAYEGYDRSFIKRNAMTFSYSSRSYGFAEQLRTDIMKPLSRNVRLGELDEHPFGKDRGFTSRQWYWARYMNRQSGTRLTSALSGWISYKVAVMRYTTRTSIFSL